jgi:hypothetical protein
VNETHQEWLLRNLRKILTENPEVDADELLGMIFGSSRMPKPEADAFFARLCARDEVAFVARVEAMIGESFGADAAAGFVKGVNAHLEQLRKATP